MVWFLGSFCLIFLVPIWKKLNSIKELFGQKFKYLKVLEWEIALNSVDDETSIVAKSSKHK